MTDELTDQWFPLRPHETQSRLWRCDKRFCLVAAGRGSGKTELARRRLVLSLPMIPAPVFYAAPTWEQVKKLAWEPLRALIPDNWIRSVSDSRLTIDTIFGSSVMLIGLDKPQRLEGLQYGGGVVDECFVAGTPVDTPRGPVPIQIIRPGDEIINPTGIRRVTGTAVRLKYRLAEVQLGPHRIVCSVHHPFLTQRGWVMAEDLRRSDHVIQTRTCASVVQGMLKALVPSLSQNLLAKMLRGAGSEGQNSPPRPEIVCFGPEGSGEPAAWPFPSPDEAALIAGSGLGAGEAGVCGQEYVQGQTHILPPGPGTPSGDAGGGGGWRSSQVARPEGEGRCQGCPPGFTRVDGLQIHQCGSESFAELAGEGVGVPCTLYDLEVEGHPSFSVHGHVVHNSCDVKPGVWDRSIVPALTHHNGWAWRIGVPKRDGVGAMEFYRACMAAANGEIPDSAYFNWPSSDILTEAQLDYARQSLSREDFIEQFGASWVTSRDNVIYYAFDEDHNVRSCSYDKSLPILVGSDFNVDPMCWVIGHYNRSLGVVEIFDEIFIRNANTRKALDILADRYGSHTKGFRFYGDATGRARKTAAAQSDYAQIEADSRFPNRQTHYPGRNPARVDRFASTNAALCNADDVRSCYIDPSCENLIADLKFRTYKPGTRDPADPSGTDIGHMTDALGYLLHEVRPGKKKLVEDNTKRIIVSRSKS